MEVGNNPEVESTQPHKTTQGALRWVPLTKDPLVEWREPTRTICSINQYYCYFKVIMTLQVISCRSQTPKYMAHFSCCGCTSNYAELPNHCPV